MKSDGVDGFAAVKFNPNNGKSVFMLEGTNLGNKNRAAIANMNQKIGKLVLSVQAALHNKEAEGALSLHFKNGLYIGAGYKNSFYMAAGISKSFSFNK